MVKKFDREKAGHTLKDPKIKLEQRFQPSQWKPLSWIEADGAPDETIYSKLGEWLRNFQTNHDTIGFPLSINQLPRLDGKPAIIIDNPMTGSLNKHLEQLSKYNRDSLTSFACDRALPKLAEHKIIPNYVCNVDSSYLTMSFFDRPEVKEIMKYVTAIFATTTFPLNIRAWQGQRAFFTPFLGSNELSATLAIKSKTVLMMTGGNVATTLWLIALNLGANPIAMVGIDNGYSALEETEYPGIYHDRFKGPYGDVYQDPVYRHYAEIHKGYIRIAKEQYRTTTINVNKSGAMYNSEIVDLSLKEFTEKYCYMRR